jgi:hypothetical protein
MSTRAEWTADLRHGFRSAEIEALANLDADAYEVAEIDGSTVVQFPGGHTLTDPQSIRHWVLATFNPPSAQRSTEMSNRFTDEASTAAQGLVERYLHPQVVTYIGKAATSAAEVMRVRRPWAQLARTECVGYVTLDTDPEVPGRPQQLRPGTEIIQWIALPEWHPLFVPGDQEVAVVRYIPSTTWLAESIEGGRVVRTPLASRTDASGFVSILGYASGITNAEEQVAELRQALRDLSAPERPDTDVEEVDPAAGRYGSAEAWGV